MAHLPACNATRLVAQRVGCLSRMSAWPDVCVLSMWLLCRHSRAFLAKLAKHSLLVQWKRGVRLRGSR